MLTKRAQILFEQDFWQKLSRFAQDQKTSVGQIIREAVAEKLNRDAEVKNRRRLIEATFEHRPKAVKGKIDYKQLINAGRKY